MDDFRQGLKDLVKDDEEYALSQKSEITDVQDAKDDEDDSIDDMVMTRTRDVKKEEKKKEDDEPVL